MASWWLHDKNLSTSVEDTLGSIPVLKDPVCLGATKPTCHKPVLS